MRPDPPGSRSSLSISVLTLKKLSARRKKPSRGSAMPRTRRRCACNPECDSRVAKRKLRLPPSALKPIATAIASSRVDLPEPFSPTKKVTCGCRGNRPSARTTGRENGKLPACASAEGLRLTSDR